MQKHHEKLTERVSREGNYAERTADSVLEKLSSQHVFIKQMLQKVGDLEEVEGKERMLVKR